MKKRLLSLFLTLCLAFCLLPGTALAMESNVQRLIVNDVDVLASENKADVLGNGTVSFDPQTGVLTLNNANLTKGCSDQAEEWAEHPAVLFHGNLTIRLKGSNTIVSGTTSVMGQNLRNNSLVGDNLTIMADPGASLTANGLFQLESYTQKNGTVTIALENNHNTIVDFFELSCQIQPMDSRHLHIKKSYVDMVKFRVVQRQFSILEHYQAVGRSEFI